MTEANDPREAPEAPVVTAEQQRRIDAWLAEHAQPDEDENGIDLSALRRNLRLTPEQRLMRLQQAANSLRRLRDARTRD